jgi:uncharacterized protein
MTLWIDADSLPREAKAIIGKRASGAKAALSLRAVFVANRSIPLPPGPNISSLLVPPGEGEADACLLAEAKPGDIIITRDIPLASQAVALGLTTLNDRGEQWTTDTIRERLSVRNHLAALRESGLSAGLDRTRSYGPREAKAFADALDRAITLTLRAAPTEQTHKSL